MEKPSENEEEYFARQQIESKRKAAAERHAKIEAEEREAARALHFMKCPKCGMQLEEISLGDVRVDKCFHCQGLWLDAGESRRSLQNTPVSWDGWCTCFACDVSQVDWERHVQFTRPAQRFAAADGGAYSADLILACRWGRLDGPCFAAPPMFFRRLRRRSTLSRFPRGRLRRRRASGRI